MADFAAAQQRILARRAAQDAALHAADTAHDDARAAQLLALPPALRTAAFRALAFWDTHLRSPYGTAPAFRVGQVDAELLDEAMLGLLMKQAGDGLRLFGAHLKDDWAAEITAALRAVLWKLSVWDHGASYGASLQGLKYVDARRRWRGARREGEGGVGVGDGGGAGGGDDAFGGEWAAATRWQRALYGVVSVGGRYAWSKWEERLAALDNGYDAPSPLMRRAGRLTALLGTSHSLAAFASFLVFLYDGRYRTLLDRALRLRLVPASNQTSREVSFEFLNRQLVWHAFTEFLLFLLPLVGISRWRRWLARGWKKAKGAVAQLRSGFAGEEGDGEEAKTGELAFLPERTCAICYQDQNPAGGQSEQQLIAAGSAAANSGIIGSAMTDITNPYETIPCGCIYCFVCLAQRIEAEEGEGWVCLRCGELVKECQPWNGDVEAARPEARPDDVDGSLKTINRRKSVTFDLKDEEKSTDYDQSSESDGAGLLASRSQNFDWSMVEDPLEEY